MKALACRASATLSFQVFRQMAALIDRSLSTTSDKGFEGGEVVVADIEERVESGVEIDGAGAEVAAVALADVKYPSFAPAAPIASAGLASSIFMWKVSRWRKTFDDPTSSMNFNPAPLCSEGWSRTD